MTELLSLPWKDEPMRDYHQSSPLSKTSLSYLSKTPAHFKWFKENPRRETAPQKFGTAAHLLLLEPDEFEKRVILKPSGPGWSANSNKYKEWKAGQPEDAILINNDEARSLEILREHAASNKVVQEIFNGNGIAERSLYFKDAGSGVDCKVRPDYIPGHLNLIVDVKTTTAADRDSFTRRATQFSYHHSACLTTLACATHGVDIDGYVFAVIESEAPHFIAFYVYEPDSLAAASREIDALLTLYTECLDADYWPAYEQKVVTVTLPNWRLKRYA